MKKRAYTLAEILIALGIIGVLAAVLAPMANKFKPDTSKVLYLNTYDALATSITDMATNGAYYVEDNGTFNFSTYPFANLDRYVDSTNPQHTIPAGVGKFCRVLAENFNILEAPNDVCRNNTQFNPDNDNFEASFTSKNGVEFMVYTEANVPHNDNTNTYLTEIIIDINGHRNNNDNNRNHGEDCIFDSNNLNACKRPDRFTFKVSADAEFIPTDEMGMRYLESRTSLKYKKIERTLANDNSEFANNVRERQNKANDVRNGFDPFTLEHSPAFQEP